MLFLLDGGNEAEEYTGALPRMVKVADPAAVTLDGSVVTPVGEVQAAEHTLVTDEEFLFLCESRLKGCDRAGCDEALVKVCSPVVTFLGRDTDELV